MIALITYAVKATDMLLSKHFWKLIALMLMAVLFVISMRLPELIEAIK